MSFPRTLLLTAVAVVLSSCGSAPQEEVIVYTALDRDFSKPILDDFTAQTGIKVRAKYDTESTKTVGLTNQLIAEAERPRCDVFWNNEILNTLRLKQKGLLQTCQPVQAAHYPPQFRDPEGFWYGFAARARVIIVNTNVVGPDDLPTSIYDFLNPKWRARTGVAKPLFGTTASHVACLYAKLGTDAAQAFLAGLKANDVQVVGGNKTCAEMVGAGKLAFGLTDTDDAIIEVEAGHPVAIVFPDAAADQMGTPVLPNTLALIKGCPHAEAGRKLIDYLLSPEVEARLAAGPSAQIPLHAQAKTTSRVLEGKTLQPMDVDFSRAAEFFPAAAKFIEQEFLAP